MRLSSIFSFVGFVLLFAGTYCPLLRPFHLFNWNVHQLSQPYGIVLVLVAVIGFVSSFLNQPKVVKIVAWVSLGLVTVLLLAAFFKVETTFSFLVEDHWKIKKFLKLTIPFKRFDALLISQIKFKWGWFVLFAGPVLALIGALSGKPKSFVPPPEAA